MTFDRLVPRGLSCWSIFLGGHLQPPSGLCPIPIMGEAHQPSCLRYGWPKGGLKSEKPDFDFPSEPILNFFETSHVRHAPITSSFFCGKKHLTRFWSLTDFAEQYVYTSVRTYNDHVCSFGVYGFDWSSRHPYPQHALFVCGRYLSVWPQNNFPNPKMIASLR